MDRQTRMKTVLPVQDLPALAQAPSLLLTSGGQDWKPVQTCSLEPLTGANIWWLLKKQVQVAKALGTKSYWNAFLLAKIYNF